MDPLIKKRLKLWKIVLTRFLPYCLFLAALAVITVGLYSTKRDNFSVSKCADDPVPGEILPLNNNQMKLADDDEYFYHLVFRRFLKEGYISPRSKILCIESTKNRLDLIALLTRKIGVIDVIGISELPYAQFTVSGQGSNHPFDNNTFDFLFFGYSSRFSWSVHPSLTASEIERTLKVGGHLVVHMAVNDEYSYLSFINLFPHCRLVSSRAIRGLENFVPLVREVVLKKSKDFSSELGSHKCSSRIPAYKLKVLSNLEPLRPSEQPKSWDGPWGDENSTIHYLPSMVDLSFKQRYVYVDLGANSYDSSIGSWFEKEYPKQNKTFEIYAVEADQTFHEEYKGKKGLTLLPYAAWVRNETLAFEVYRQAPEMGQQWEKMGWIREDASSSKVKDSVEKVFKVEAFDFTEWLIRTVSKKDFVVVKMDVEGAEFNLMKRLIESGALCLIDELFLECHYDRSDEEISKYNVTYEHCLNMFKTLRDKGCIVHQWW